MAELSQQTVFGIYTSDQRQIMSLHTSAYERCPRSKLSHLSAGLMLTHGRFVTRQDADGTSVLLGNIRSSFSLDGLFLCTHNNDVGA